MKKKLLLVVVYLTLAAWSAGALYADLVSSTPEIYVGGSKAEQRLRRRHAAGISIAVGLLPVAGPLVALFVTGFYASGWMMPGSVPQQPIEESELR